jgi:Zn-dependent peptidase ImmA (M78 family)
MRRWIDDTGIRADIRRLLERAKITCPPVDLEAVAQCIGDVDVEEAYMGELLGSVERSEHKFKIRVNASEPHRRRFTLAHEIAHALLMRTVRRGTAVRLRVREPAKYDEQERLCDGIAAEILMPYHLFRPRVLRLPVSIEAIRRLADEFDTSVQATAIRYAHLTEQEMATILWRHNQDSLVARVTPSQPGVHLGGQWAHRPVDELRNGPAHAFHCNHIVVTWETKCRAGKADQLYCESLGLLSGKDRFVLSLVKTGVTPEAFDFRQHQAHRSCTMAARGDPSQGGTQWS